MTFIVWFAMLGAVLLLLALSSSYLRWIPVTSSVVCLALGIWLGPSGLGFLQLDVNKSSAWMEHLTEVAVLFSLFFSGLKLRLPLHDRLTAWYRVLESRVLRMGSPDDYHEELLRQADEMDRRGIICWQEWRDLRLEADAAYLRAVAGEDYRPVNPTSSSAE